MYEAVGTRAQGLGGAFVAVADDATATWWNPAGLATGAYFNAIIERGRTTEPSDPSIPRPIPGGGSRVGAQRQSVDGFVFAVPSLGLSYFRVRTGELRSATSTGVDGADRQDLGAAEFDGRQISISQYGATFGQSLGGHIVLGSTVKLVRASATNGVVSGGNTGLDSLDDLDGDTETKADLDIGAMVSFPRVRLGVAARNIRQPEFTSGDQVGVLKRKVRTGVAWLVGKHGILDGFTASGDADLTRTMTLFGEVRHVAGGAEVWLFGRHLGIRGGLTGNTIGPMRRAVSMGASVAPATGFFIEAARTTGADESLKGWSAALRVSF
jgi:hypothetical protein